MFTGFISHTTTVLAKHEEEQGLRLILASPFTDIEQGESIAVNGVCLTALTHSHKELHFDVSPETLEVTTLASLALGQQVNLERAMTANSRFGGHYVSGHVDTTAFIKEIICKADYNEIILSGFTTPALFYLIPKGSITVDGVSLTINKVEQGKIHLMLIPHTLSHTSLGGVKNGDRVNIEFDYLTRIVAHQLQLQGQLNFEVLS